MSYQHTEFAKYSREQVEEILKFNAKLALIGSVYYGKIEDQEIRWLDDGSVEILTKHTPSPHNPPPR